MELTLAMKSGSLLQWKNKNQNRGSGEGKTGPDLGLNEGGPMKTLAKACQGAPQADRAGSVGRAPRSALQVDGCVLQLVPLVVLSIGDIYVERARPPFFGRRSSVYVCTPGASVVLCWVACLCGSFLVKLVGAWGCTAVSGGSERSLSLHAYIHTYIYTFFPALGQRARRWKVLCYV